MSKAMATATVSVAATATEPSSVTMMCGRSSDLDLGLRIKLYVLGLPGGVAVNDPWMLCP